MITAEFILGALWGVFFAALIFAVAVIIDANKRKHWRDEMADQFDEMADVYEKDGKLQYIAGLRAAANTIRKKGD